MSRSRAAAFFGRAVPMYGGADKVTKAVWPQAFPYVTDLDKAKALMAEAGFAQGIETTLASIPAPRRWASRPRS